MDLCPTLEEIRVLRSATAPPLPSGSCPKAIDSDGGSPVYPDNPSHVALTPNPHVMKTTLETGGGWGAVRGVFGAVMAMRASAAGIGVPCLPPVCTGEAVEKILSCDSFLDGVRAYLGKRRTSKYADDAELMGAIADKSKQKFTFSLRQRCSTCKIEIYHAAFSTLYTLSEAYMPDTELTGKQCLALRAKWDAAPCSLSAWALESHQTLQTLGWCHNRLSAIRNIVLTEYGWFMDGWWFSGPCGSSDTADLKSYADGYWADAETRWGKKKKVSWVEGPSTIVAKKLRRRGKQSMDMWRKKL